MSKKAGDDRRESQKGASAVTTSICAETWVTSVNGNDDGEVEVMDDGGNKLKGTHKKSGDRITGHCTEGPPHLIHIERTDNTGTVHTYDGRIFRINLPLKGSVPITLIIGTHKPSKALADDDWMGGHTT
jgi:hypothetical protein